MTTSFMLRKVHTQRRKTFNSVPYFHVSLISHLDMSSDFEANHSFEFQIPLSIPRLMSSQREEAGEEKASDLSMVSGSQNYNTLPPFTKQSPAAAALVLQCQHHSTRLD